MLTTFNLQNRFEEFGAKLGEEIGNKLVAKLSILKSSQLQPKKPVTFRGDVLAALFSAAEAEAIFDHLDIINEYGEQAGLYAQQGVSLMAFAQSKIADVKGTPYPGMPDNMSADLRSAFKKQSDRYAEKFAVRRGW